MRRFDMCIADVYAIPVLHLRYIAQCKNRRYAQPWAGSFERGSPDLSTSCKIVPWNTDRLKTTGAFILYLTTVMLFFYPAFDALTRPQHER
jgi:hypothetical protein